MTKSTIKANKGRLIRLVRSHRRAILHLADKYGARNVRIFGSVARGEEKKNSDVDFLVKMESGRSLLDLVGFWQDVQETIHHRADVVSEGGLNPYLRDRILNEAIEL